MHHMFGGYLRNQVACLSCGHVSKSYESSLSLVLELPYRAPSLEAALQHFTKRERLDGDNKYRCDRWAAGGGVSAWAGLWRWGIVFGVSGVALAHFGTRWCGWHLWCCWVVARWCWRAFSAENRLVKWLARGNK